MQLPSFARISRRFTAQLKPSRSFHDEDLRVSQIVSGPGDVRECKVEVRAKG